MGRRFKFEKSGLTAVVLALVLALSACGGSADYDSNIKSDGVADPGVVMLSQARDKSETGASSEQTSKPSKSTSQVNRKTSSTSSKTSESSSLETETSMTTTTKATQSSTKKADPTPVVTTTKKTTEATSPSTTPKATAAAATTKPTTKATTPPATPTPEPTPIPTPQPTPTPEPVVVAPPDNSASFIGNSNTMKFHRAGCSSVNKMKDEHKVYFATREDAINGDYVPCKICKP
jgi:hypothetical protein